MGATLKLGGKGKVCCCEAIPAFISQVWTLFVLIQLLFDFKSGRLLEALGTYSLVIPFSLAVT